MIKNIIYIKYTLLFLFLTPCIAHAQFDKKCYLKNILYVSPSIAGCVFGGSTSGEMFFKLNNLDIQIDKCLSRLNLSDKNLKKFKNDISKIEKDLKINDQNQLPILFVKVHKDGYSGKVISKRMLGISSFEIPFMKKNLEGIANVFLDNGLTINLKVFEKASLKLIGGFGKISLQGRCLPYTD